MKPIDHRVTDLVRESEKPHKSLEDRSPFFEPVELPRHRRRRGRLHHKVCPSRQLPAEIAQIREEARLTRLVNLREKILQFLTTQYPTIEAAKGTHWYKVYNSIIRYRIGFDSINQQSLTTTILGTVSQLYRCDCSPVQITISRTQIH